MRTIASRKHTYLTTLLADVPNEADCTFKFVQHRNVQFWAYNHARLFMNQDLEAANAFFATVALDPNPVDWGGFMDTADWDFEGIRYLLTYMQFGHSDRLSTSAKANLRDEGRHPRQVE